jgi:hypothetical protein
VQKQYPALHEEYVRNFLEIFTQEKGASLMSIVTNEILAQVRESLLEVAPLAAQLLRDIITGDIPAPLGVRAKYASEALARVGFGPITKTVSHSMRETLSMEDIERIKQRAIAASEAVEIEAKEIRE